MENKITIKIDLEKMTDDILKKETYSEEGETGYGIIQDRLKQEIKDYIKDGVFEEIKESLNLSEFKDREYTSDYLKLTANKILDEQLEQLVKDKTEDWVKKNMRWIVEEQAEKSIKEFLLPRMQKIIKNLMIIDTEAVENEMQELKDDYETQLEELEK